MRKPRNPKKYILQNILQLIYNIYLVLRVLLATQFMGSDSEEKFHNNAGEPFQATQHGDRIYILDGGAGMQMQVFLPPPSHLARPKRKCVVKFKWVQLLFTIGNPIEPVSHELGTQLNPYHSGIFVWTLALLRQLSKVSEVGLTPALPRLKVDIALGYVFVMIQVSDSNPGTNKEAKRFRHKANKGTRNVLSQKQSSRELMTPEPESRISYH